MAQNRQKQKAGRPLIIGNWKMHGRRRDLQQVRGLLTRLEGHRRKADIMICPPFHLLSAMAEQLKGQGILLGGQDCHQAPAGAHTGDISAVMLKDAGAQAVLVGHSERRTAYGETDRLVRDKAQAAHQAGLLAVICIGETLQQRRAKQTLRVLSRQLRGSLPPTASHKNTVLAYEPVWAIGSGRTPVLIEIAAVHDYLRRATERRLAAHGAATGQPVAAGAVVGASLRLLYGGSVTAKNAADILAIAHVDGVLVGGASLRAADFAAIIKAA